MVFTNPASANDERTFEGTLAEWNALTLVQKTFYTKAIINDDYSDNPVGNLNALNTTDKSSCVGAINEVNGVINALNSRVMTSGNSYVQSADFRCRSGYACISVNAFVQNVGCVIFDIVVSDGVVTTKDCMTGEALSSSVATVTYNYGVLTITFSASATYTAIYQTPLS